VAFFASTAAPARSAASATRRTEARGRGRGSRGQGGMRTLTNSAARMGPVVQAEISLLRCGWRSLRTGCPRIPKFALCIMRVEDTYRSAAVFDRPHVVVGKAAVELHSLGQAALYELKLLASKAKTVQMASHLICRPHPL
jgi:hypothetical protein